MDFESGFWQAYQRFLKTPLLTEAPHPQTANLSELAKNDLPAAYKLLRYLDLHAIDVAVKSSHGIEIKANGRIILVGCGASGRIAEQIEYWSRSVIPAKAGIQAVLAGGDVTLIEAIESCEDNPEFARKQMALLDLSKDDVVIGLSAGGESPFILEALRFAADKTKAKPILLCCNPAKILLERDPTHLAGDSRFEVIALVVGAMALTGSTRMQATTAMTLFLILTLLPEQFKLEDWYDFYKSLDFNVFCGMTIWEAERFAAKNRVTYHADSTMALPILADLTERSPTFNIPRLFHQNDAKDVAALALILDDAKDALDAWHKLLGREPKALNFEGFDKTHMGYLLGFDLSIKAPASHFKVSLKKAFPEYFDLSRRAGLTVVERDFLLRLVLVNHSTLMMGRLGFYTGNLMTSLKPANFKLIDRAIRYVLFLYAQKTGKSLDYKKVAEVLFAIMPTLKPEESIVFRVLDLLL